MRDVVAGVIAVALLAVAASLATTLQGFRRRRQRAHETEESLGRALIAEIPSEDNLVLFSEDASRFYYGEQAIEKDAILAARVLINGAPIAACVSRRAPPRAAAPQAGFDDRPDGIARDRWDVAIETIAGTTLVECGAIRERVSQELARAVFDAVKAELERRDAAETRRHGEDQPQRHRSTE
jgi:hypothetical protein